MEGGVVRRVRDDPSYRQRRGSIKSRIVQFSKVGHHYVTDIAVMDHGVANDVASWVTE